MHHRVVRTGLLVASWVALAVLAPVSLAVAQSRPAHPKAAAKPKPTASAAPENPYEDKAAPASSASAAPGPSVPSGSADAPAAPPPGEPTDAGRLSPLNPEPPELSDAAVAAPPVDYDRLLADIGALRARVAAVSDTLFHSRIAIGIRASGDHARVAVLTVSLDDGAVWTSPAAFRADEATTVYEHAVAPGHHAVTVDVERRDDRNDVFRSAQRSRFIVDVPADQRLAVDLEIKDESNMGGDFPSDKRGRYDLRVRASARAEPVAAGVEKGKAP